MATDDLSIVAMDKLPCGVGCRVTGVRERIEFHAPTLAERCENHAIDGAECYAHADGHHYLMPTRNTTIFRLVSDPDLGCASGD